MATKVKEESIGEVVGEEKPKRERYEVAASASFAPMSFADLPKMERGNAGNLKGRADKWGVIVKQFLESGAEAAKINFPPKEGSDPVKLANSVRGAIAANIKRSGMPAVAVRRNDEVYLVRGDLNGNSESHEAEDAGLPA